jgi:multicomponent Na+:H+ antiporter subunit D
MIAASLPPGLILILGALLIPLARGRVRAFWLLALPLLSLAHWAALFGLPPGDYLSLGFFDYQLVLARVDKLSLVFALVFHLATLLATVYSLHVKDTIQHVAALSYAGSAIGAVFAGDLLTLFLYWELTAVTSVFLIWASRTRSSYRAGMRYLIIQVGSGVILLAGILFLLTEGGSLRFEHLGLGSTGRNLIFLAFGIKSAFPLLHNWLQDTYPEATPTGTVWLSIFTTKLAVYALARAFAGTEILIYIGAAMTAFPIFYAVIENDLRRVLAYSLNNQLGFLVAGVGIGTPLALNGTAAHAFANIIFEGLLFMAMGAVLYRTGTIKGSELGGLYKSMPWSTGLCIVGAASISAFPLFAGFVSKSLIISAAAEEHYLLTWFVLVFASAGVFHHSGIKIPFFAFFAHDSGIRVKEAPFNMLLAMGVMAVLCIAIGCFPEPLYGLLPYPVEYVPYTATHVITQLQLLSFAALAFTFLMRTGIYPPELRSTNLDSDWIYRRALPVATLALGRAIARADRCVRRGFLRLLGAALARLYRHLGPHGILARTWATGQTVLWVAILLGVFLILYYV